MVHRDSSLLSMFMTSISFWIVSPLVLRDRKRERDPKSCHHFCQGQSLNRFWSLSSSVFRSKPLHLHRQPRWCRTQPSSCDHCGGSGRLFFIALVFVTTYLFLLNLRPRNFLRLSWGNDLKTVLLACIKYGRSLSLSLPVLRTELAPNHFWSCRIAGSDRGKSKSWQMLTPSSTPSFLPCRPFTHRMPKTICLGSQ